MFVFPGFNSNIEHRNKTYHIQTEVNSVGDENRINTVVYLSGTILTSTATTLSKEDSLNRETAVKAVRKQHNKVIRDLISDQLAPQKKKDNKDAIDFSGMYGNHKALSSQGVFNSFEIYKSLLLHDDDETLQ
jgi:hypothetical protein